MASRKVVYHINYPGGPDDKKYKGALRNIQNHINAVGVENLDLKVVMHGNGVGLVMNAKQSDALQTAIGSLKGQNVTFHVCANTLRGREISYENDLYDTWEQDIVPSALPSCRICNSRDTPISNRDTTVACEKAPANAPGPFV